MPEGACWPTLVEVTDVQKPERLALSRYLSEFLIELSIALHRHSMYPSGHPSLGPAVDGVVQRASRLLEDRPSIAFGVARRQLIIEGVTTDPNQPVLRRLAEVLHAHHLGAISFWRGVQAEEVTGALRALAAEPERHGPVGLKPSDQAVSWSHLKLHPLTFDGLALVGDAPTSTERSGGKDRIREAELWVGLARAALSIEDGTADASNPIPTEPSVVARAIDEHPSAEAYDQVIVGYLLQIAKELRSATGAEGEALRRKTSSLIAALRPETLRRLVEMSGDVGQRSEFVLDATHGMAVEAVMEILKAAADASGQTISHGLVRMLSKLAAHTESGSAQARTRADVELREQVTQLLSGWQLEDPNPDAYGRVLQLMATSATPEIPSAAAEGAIEAGMDSLRVVQMSLESGVYGPLVTKSLEHVVQEGRLSAALDLLTARPGGCDEVAEAIVSTLAHPATLSMLMSRESVDVASLEPLIQHVSVAGLDVLLEGLATSEVRPTRRRLLDLLSRSDLDITGLIAARLADERWYVQRNMLVLLERSGRIPDGFSASPWTSHPDARVRHAAIRLQLTLAPERDLAIRTALEDTDSRIVALGLTAIPRECLTTVVPRVAEIALQPDADEEVRALAARVLGRVRQPVSLNALLQLSDGGRSLLGRLKLPPRTAVLVAAIRGLAEQWATDPRAASVLSLAAQSSDTELRQAADGARR